MRPPAGTATVAGSSSIPGDLDEGAGPKVLLCIPDVLGWPELKSLRAVIAKGEFADGKTTAGARARRVKDNVQMTRGTEATRSAQATVLKALRGNETFQRAALPKSIRPPLISRYLPGMRYGAHVDDALMGRGTKTRSDVAVTLFISDPADYEGGELLIESPYGPQEIKLPAGSAVIYPSSTLHRVAEVTRGERLAAVTWVQSYLRDPARRELLYDLHRIRTRLAALDPDSEETDLAYKTYANLLRLWSE